MEPYKLAEDQFTQYKSYLKKEERSAGTREKYLRDIHAFAVWLGEKEVTKQNVLDWKAHLQQENYAPATINSMLAAVNAFFRFMHWDECRVKALRIQRRAFRDTARELTKREYDLLVRTARGLGNERLALVMETICATGIRVSEVKYITAEAVRCGRVEISLKGKIRTILLPGKLCRKLRKYAEKQKIASGEIFLTRSGASLSRRQIWAEMKRLCRRTGVAPSKVFPHNLRHLFAMAFYRASRDIAKLADVLGHSSIETTRIYLMTTGTEHVRLMEQLHLVS